MLASQLLEFHNGVGAATELKVAARSVLEMSGAQRGLANQDPPTKVLQPPDVPRQANPR